MCHCAPKFNKQSAAQFSQLPVSAMALLLRKDDIDVTSEFEVALKQPCDHIRLLQHRNIHSVVLLRCCCLLYPSD